MKITTNYGEFDAEDARALYKELKSLFEPDSLPDTSLREVLAQAIKNADSIGSHKHYWEHLHVDDQN